MMTATDHMKAAFAALLAGDTVERDRQCFLAEEAIRAEAKFHYASGLPLLKGCQDTRLWLNAAWRKST